MAAFKLLNPVPIGVIGLRNGSVSWNEEPPDPDMAPGSAAQDGDPMREETSNVIKYFE